MVPSHVAVHMHCNHVVMEGEELEGVQPRKRRARNSPPFVLADHFDNGWCIHCERQAKLALLPTARRSTYIAAKVCVAGWFWHMDGATRLLATLRSASRGALSFADATCSATFNVRLPMLCVCLPPGLAAMSRPPGGDDDSSVLQDGGGGGGTGDLVTHEEEEEEEEDSKGRWMVMGGRALLAVRACVRGRASDGPSQ